MVLAGGTESMSNTPYLLPRARWGYRLGNAEIVDGMYQDGFNDPLSKLVMGETAEELARGGRDRPRRLGRLGRREPEPLRAGPRPRAASTPRSRRSRSPGKKGEVTVETDEHPRDGVTLDSLTKLQPVFRKGGAGDRGQRLGDHRRRRRDRRGLAPRPRRSWACPSWRGWWAGRSWASSRGSWASARCPPCASCSQKTGARHRRHRRGRAQRGLRLPGARLPPGASTSTPRDGQSGRRRHRPRPSRSAPPAPASSSPCSTAWRARGGERGIATLCVSGGMGIAALVEREAA